MFISAAVVVIMIISVIVIVVLLCQVGQAIEVGARVADRLEYFQRVL